MEIKKITLSDNHNRRLDEGINNLISDYNKSDSITHINKYPIPSKDTIVKVIQSLFDILYPGYYSNREISNTNIKHYYGNKVSIVFETLALEIAKSIRHDHNITREKCEVCDQCIEKGIESALLIVEKLPVIRNMLMKDVSAAFDGDPAAKSYHEIIFSYPGLFSITVHRIAHELYKADVPLIPRIMSEYSHSKTGIDIHPGATIGEFFFIDHGTGVVIGETCKIGNNVKLYQGVTLGALSFPKDDRGTLIKGLQRHPIIEDSVTIYANATILGGETVIGKNSTVGGNVWVTESIPPNSKVLTTQDGPKIVTK